MSYIAIFDLNPEDYIVVDRDTGTVLGTNLVVIKSSNLTEDEREEISNDDSVAIEYAEDPDLAQPLWVEEDEVE
jgi:hypothetical protein